ncbi:MAG: hypothetical protein IJX01_07495 [Oscillospiraceae bacterium]|nr:hypothetical protein [Oscillospiraceae bacterium]
MFKKITSIILAILLILSFAGCSRPVNGPTPASNVTQATQATEAPDETEVATKSTTAKATSGNKATKATTAKATTTATQSTTKATVKPTIATKATQAATKATATKVTTATKATQAATKATTAATVSSPTESTTDGIETDEKLFSVDITLPASLFEGEDMTKFDADAYANEQGFKSAKVNADGSVTVTMTKAKHKELLDEMANSLDKDFAEFVNGEDTPYIKEISHNDHFTAVTMKVDNAAYESAFDFTPLSIAFSVAMYQAFTEAEYYVEVSIVDAATGAKIDSITFPDAFNS